MQILIIMKTKHHKLKRPLDRIQAKLFSTTKALNVAADLTNGN